MASVKRRNEIEPEVYGEVQLGVNSTVDPFVRLGYPPARVHSKPLIIGPNARIRQGTIIYASSTIGSKLETGHNVVIREENFIGDEFSIWSHSTVDYGCRIGNRVKIHHNVYVAQYTIIEDDVFLGPGVIIANDSHPGCPLARDCMEGPVIKRGAQIGAVTVLLPRVIIGEYALVGAGSVVTKDVPPRAVVYGNPARVMGWIQDLNCTTGLMKKPYGHLAAVLNGATKSI